MQSEMGCTRHVGPFVFSHNNSEHPPSSDLQVNKKQTKTRCNQANGAPTICLQNSLVLFTYLQITLLIKGSQRKVKRLMSTCSAEFQQAGHCFQNELGIRQRACIHIYFCLFFLWFVLGLLWGMEVKVQRRSLAVQILDNSLMQM